MFTFLAHALLASWNLLMQAAPFILFGLLIGGMLKVFLSPAYVAGITENFFNPPDQQPPLENDQGRVPGACCSKDDPSAREHGQHGLTQKFLMGMRYGATDLWDDLAGWFLLGVLLAGFITVLVPDSVVFKYLGGGLSSMLLMLVAGIPIYICATASTPIAAAFILKGVSPGTALVFLLVGPATNVTSLSVLFGILGRRATAIYLATIAVVSVLCGLMVDALYLGLGISATATVGKAAGMLPSWLMAASSLLLLALSVRPLARIVRGWKQGNKESSCCGNQEGPRQKPTLQPFPSHSSGCGCGCSGQPQDVLEKSDPEGCHDKDSNEPNLVQIELPPKTPPKKSN